MARVLKRESTLAKNKMKLQDHKNELIEEAKALERRHQTEIYQQTAVGAVIGTIFLIPLFPVGTIIGLIIGLLYGRNKYLGEINKKIRDVKISLYQRSGAEGEQKVSDRIEQDLSDEYILLNDVVVSHGKKPTQVDHILISSEKIYCLETKDITGKFYPHGPNKWKWFPYESRGFVRRDTIVPNPQKQSSYHADAIKKVLDKHKHRVPVIPAVILTHPSGKWMGKQNWDCPILTPRKMIKLLNRPLKDKISEENKQKIAGLLLDYDRRYSEEFYQGIVQD